MIEKNSKNDTEELPNKRVLSERLRNTLDELEVIMGQIGAVSDDLYFQYLVERGEIDPDEKDDFISRP